MDNGVVVDVVDVERVVVLDEVVQKLDVAVSHGEHGWAPVVEGPELVDEAGVVLEELDDFLGLSLF